MKSNVPWSVKGIAPEARVVAKDAAKKAGLTLGEWLNQTIQQSADGGVALDGRPAQSPAAPQNEVPANVVTVDQLRELVNSLNRMNDRLRATEENSRSAAYGLEQGLTSVLERIQRVEQSNGAGESDLGERVQKLENGGGTDKERAESLKSLENALRQIVHQFETTQTETAERVVANEESIKSLATQLDQLDSQTAAAFKQVSEAVDMVSNQVTQTEKTAKAVMLEARAAAGSEDPDFVERTGQKLRILGKEIKRSGDQIQQLEKLISKLSGKIEASEQRSAEGIVRVSETIEALREEVQTVSVDADGSRSQETQAALMQATSEADSRLTTLQASFDQMVKRLDSVVESRAKRLAAEGSEPAAKETVKEKAPDVPTTEVEHDAEFDEVFGNTLDQTQKASEAELELPPLTDADSTELFDENAPQTAASEKLTPKQKVILAARARRKRLEKQASETTTPPEVETAPEDAGAEPAPAKKDSILSKLKPGTGPEKAATPDNSKTDNGTSTDDEHQARLEALRTRYGDREQQGKGLPFYLLLAAGLIIVLGLVIWLFSSFFGKSDKPSDAAAPPTQVEQTAQPTAPASENPTIKMQRTTPVDEGKKLYRDGIGFLRTAETEEAKVEAVERFRRAALLGNVPAKHQLGELYQQGIGVNVNANQAKLWYEEAANGGNVLAMHRLGVMLIQSNEGASSETDGLRWFEKAASYGQKDSMFNLGYLYNPEEGDISPDLKSVAKSYYWYGLSSRLGDEVATELVNEVGATLPPEEKVAQDRAIAAWEAIPLIEDANDRMLMSQ